MLHRVGLVNIWDCVEDSQRHVLEFLVLRGFLDLFFVVLVVLVVLVGDNEVVVFGGFFGGLVDRGKTQALLFRRNVELRVPAVVVEVLLRQVLLLLQPCVLVQRGVVIFLVGTHLLDLARDQVVQPLLHELLVDF